MAVTAAEAARTLRERAAAKRAQREARAQSALGIVREEVARRLGTTGKAWLIGSLAWGGFGPGSDVDIVLEDPSGIDITRLEIDLSERVGVEVDVLVLRELPASFQARVLREGVALHEC